MTWAIAARPRRPARTTRPHPPHTRRGTASDAIDRPERRFDSSGLSDRWPTQCTCSPTFPPRGGHLNVYRKPSPFHTRGHGEVGHYASRWLKGVHGSPPKSPPSVLLRCRDTSPHQPWSSWNAALSKCSAPSRSHSLCWGDRGRARGGHGRRQDPRTSPRRRSLAFCRLVKFRPCAFRRTPPPARTRDPTLPTHRLASPLTEQCSPDLGRRERRGK